MENKLAFVTFRKIGSYEVFNLTENKPSCFNNQVNIRKYKITIEPIEEPVEVLQERLQKLWDECDNMHHWRPLKDAAKEIGYEFKNNAGTKRIKR